MLNIDPWPSRVGLSLQSLRVLAGAAAHMAIGWAPPAKKQLSYKWGLKNNT